MSRKSQKRIKRHCTPQMPTNILLLQKQTIRATMLDYLWITIFLLFTELIVFFVGVTRDGNALAHGWFWIPELLLIPLIIIFAAAYTRRAAIFRIMKDIPCTTEPPITIQCEKASVLIHPTSRYSYSIGCIIFRDRQGKKYYYPYPAGHFPPEAASKQLQKMLSGRELILVCYKNTPIVTTFPDLPIP